jgi:hypothetical protein
MIWKLVVGLLLVLSLAVCAKPCAALEADDLTAYVGYTIVAASSVDGDFEGADFGKTTKLMNGMVFEFQNYSYTYSYMPTAVVLARAVTVPSTGRDVTIYVLIVEDEAYDVLRLR